MKLSLSLLSLLFLLLLSACSTKSGVEYFDKANPSKEQAILNNRQGTIGEGSQIKALISTIYLNTILNSSQKDQHYFLISIFDTEDLPISSYKIELAGVEPSGLVKLDNNCTLIDLLPQKQPWSSYYEAVFSSNENNLTLTIERGSDKLVLVF